MKAQVITFLGFVAALSTAAQASEMCQGPAGQQTRIDLTNPACVSTAGDARGSYERAMALVMEQATASTKKNAKYVKAIAKDFGADNMAKVRTYTAAIKGIDARTDLNLEEKAASKEMLRAKLDSDLTKISKKFNGRYSDINCPLFDPSDDHEVGCNLHTGIFGDPNLATPSFSRQVYSSISTNGHVGYTVCAFKRLDEPDNIASEMMFHDSRAWLDGNYHESKDPLHYLPVSVCSSVELSGPAPVFNSLTPEQALKHPTTSTNFGRFRHQGTGNGVPFYSQSVDSYVLSKMPEFCMKSCAPPIVKTADVQTQPVKTVPAAAPAAAAGQEPATTDATKTTAE